jgi:hypothetical protein
VRLFVCTVAIVISVAGTLGRIAAENTTESVRKELQQSCQPCHSLRLVETQRLSAAAWQKEMDKMIGWGAVVPNKQLLIDYLSQHYGNQLPPPAPILSTPSK